MAIDKIQSESINLADTFAFTGTVTGAGGTNTPIFFGKSANDQTLTRGTTTKITGMTGGEIDSDTAFDGTTFTVPSGKGGTYFIYGAVTGDAGDIGQDGEQIRMMIYKNGSRYRTSTSAPRDNYGYHYNNYVAAVVDMNGSSDYVELYGLTNKEGGTDCKITKSHEDSTYFGAYRILT